MKIVGTYDKPDFQHLGPIMISSQINDVAHMCLHPMFQVSLLEIMHLMLSQGELFYSLRVQLLDEPHYYIKAFSYSNITWKKNKLLGFVRLHTQQLQMGAYC